MRTWRYFLFCLCIPLVSWGSTHVINQAYFLSSKTDKSWNKKDSIIVLGADKIDINLIAKARKNFAKSTPIYWLMSDDQWNYNNITLNKDQKVIDFANQMEELFIQVLPQNLCPIPAFVHEKNFDIMLIDSSWILFPHQTELFKQQCSNTDVGIFYNEIEEGILNAKLKPLIILSYHGVHPNLIDNKGDASVARLANQIQQSLGPMNGISNPAYQKYQERMNHLMGSRPNIMFVSANTTGFFRNSNMSTHHLGLPLIKPTQVTIENNKLGSKISTNEFQDQIILQFNQSYVSDNATCEEYTGSMFDFKLSGWIYEYFLGTNYRKLWNKNLSIDCFDVDKENLTIERIGGSIRSPDFLLKDKQGKLYTLRPLKKEIHVPEILQDTVVERVMIDQQSSIFPLGFMLASNLSRQAGILSETSRLVYVDTDQRSFASWREKKFPSGFYQFSDQPTNLLKDPEVQKKGVVEILNTKDMISRLENQSGYRLDQQNYLKSRLFDMLIGDWDRLIDQWQWVVIQTVNGKLIEPFPVDREASFYHADGVVSWWRRRKWINYKLQDYAKRLSNPEPYLVQSLSMDHRYTSALTQKDWDAVVADLLSKLTIESMDLAISSLPVALSAEDHKRIITSFKDRLKNLPETAREMRNILRESVDIIGTPGKDSFYIQSGPGKHVYVSSSNKSNATTFSDKFDSKETKEIRIYGLDGDDDFKLNWQNYTSTKIRIISGSGKDTIIARDEKMKPRISLFDDNTAIDSYYGFVQQEYRANYNDYYSQINARKLNELAPVLFLASSNADSGFILGGGLKYYKAGFQHAPWESVNEIKANVVLNRSAANIMYQHTDFDFYRAADLSFGADAGLPRFYGSFFGLGNSPPDLDPTKPEDYYWMRARHLEVESKATVPVLQNISLIPRVQFRFRDYLIERENFLNRPLENNLDTQLKTGANADMRNANYYVGTGLALNYTSADTVSGPVKKRIIRAEAKYMFQQGLAHEDSHFQTLDLTAGLTGYFSKSKTQWKINGGYGANYGHWEFFDAQFLGNGQNLRGFYMNRFAGSSRFYDSAEINQSLLFRKWSIITDFGLGAYFDSGRVFLENDTTSNRLHKAVGLQAWITGLNSIAFKTAYSHAIFEDQKGFWSFVLTTEL